MSPALRRRSARRAVRFCVLVAVVVGGLFAPIQMARGTPETRFAAIAAGVEHTAGYRAAAIGPNVPPPPGPVLDMPWPVSHVGARWYGNENAVVEFRTASGDDAAFGPWRTLTVDHDLEDTATGRSHSQIIRVDEARRLQVRAAGGATGVEIIAIDTVFGPRPWTVAVGRPAAANEEPQPAPPAPSPTPPAEPPSPSPSEEGGDEPAPDPAASTTTTTTTTPPVPREANAVTTTTTSTTTTTTTAPKGSTTSSSSTTSTTRPGATSGTGSEVPQPQIVSRREWGADESWRKPNPPKYAPITKLFVHHTVTSPGASDPDPAATVRAIYAFHTKSRGWDDIGYNFLVDHTGKIYEGRWAQDYEPGEIPTGENDSRYGVVGAHAEYFNFGTASVSVIGDFTDVEPTSPAMKSVEKFLAWKADRHDVDVTKSDPFVNSAGVRSTFPNLSGHRDVGSTACPGNRLYSLLPELRERVAEEVDIAKSSTRGYWSATADGRVLPFGGVESFGSMTGLPLNAPIVGMEATTTFDGYWLLGGDGGVFSFGDAQFFGSTGAIKLNKPVVRLAATPTGKGYWLVASDGGIFAFGDAAFYGSTGALTLNSPVASMAPAPDGTGYWMVAKDGGVFAFDVDYFGSAPGMAVAKYPGAVQVRATSTGAGYYIADIGGGVLVFGDARYYGSDISHVDQHGVLKDPKRFVVDIVIRPAKVASADDPDGSEGSG